MNFTRADYLSAITDKQFIADLVPKHPIYCCLLSQETQSVIGLPHPTSQRAEKILKEEGFQFNFYIDIFDAGPTLETRLNQIKTINTQQLRKVTEIKPVDKQESNTLVANTHLRHFRLSAGPIHLSNNHIDITLSPELAAHLHITLGDQVSIAPI